jgi:hypothetical protein
VYISERMLMVVPPSKAEIKSTNECNIVVYDNEFFMMRPVECHISRIFENIMIGMSHDDDVSMAFGTFRAEPLKGMFGVCRIASERSLNVLA